MEIKSSVLPRLVPWLVLLAVAFAVGRWSGLRTPESKDDEAAEVTVLPTAPAPAAEHPPADPVAAAREALPGKVDAILAATRSMLQPDAQTYAFFENLRAEEAPTVAEHLARMPPGNERDLLLVMAMRSWGTFDGRAAVTRANALGNLPMRAAARAAAYEAWGRRDTEAAFEHARDEKNEGDRQRAFAALLTGGAIKHPGAAITFWEAASEAFRLSPAGREALENIATAACGTGQREAMVAIIEALPPGEERALLSAAVARIWGVHDPEAAVAWVKTTTPAGTMQDGIVDQVFTAYVRKDPVRAAEWAARQSDERRRTNYVAAAVAEWATFDTPAAETWVNEQPEGGYLDGATYAIAAHFIEKRRLHQAFAWTRRIMRNEARADLLGNLGRIWSTEKPDDFKSFLAETSLNRAELEMLRSKIIEVPPPSP